MLAEQLRNLNELLSPSDSTWLANNKPKLQWNSTADNVSGVWKYQLYINENLNVDDVFANVTSILPASNLSDGSYLWYITANDSAKNIRQSNSKWLLRIDTTPPKSEIVNLTSVMQVSADTLVIETQV